MQWGVDLINESASFDISAMFGLDLDMYYIFRYSIEENDTNLLKRVDRRRKAYRDIVRLFKTISCQKQTGSGIYRFLLPDQRSETVERSNGSFFTI